MYLALVSKHLQFSEEVGGGGRPIYEETKECGPCLEPDSIKLTVKKEKKKN